MNDAISLIMPAKNGEYEVTESYLQSKQQEFPDLNVAMLILSMCSWSKANPSKRKTKQGMNRFITSWLIRSREDNAKTSSSNSALDQAIKLSSSNIDTMEIDDGDVWG